MSQQHNSDCFERKSHKTFVVILCIFSYFLLMFGNGMVSLTHPDEVFYIQSAKEMVANNSWLTPMIFDEVQFEKPFLAFAMFAGAIKWFGLNSSAARFWPAFFGILGSVVVYWIAWMLFRRKRLAFISGLMLSSSFIYLALSRAVLTDMIFSIFVAITMGFFYLSYCCKKWRQNGMILSFLFAAIAVLTKGLLGFIFPGFAIFLFLAYKKDLKFLWHKATLLGLMTFLVVALPWHILMYAQHGAWFLEEYFGNVHVRRIFASEHARLDNWWFYFMLMFVGVMPWTLFWVPAIGDMFKQFRQKCEGRDKLVFLFAWIISIYVFTQPAHSKLASYIFPLFPAVAIFLAQYLNKKLDDAINDKFVMSLTICGYAMCVFVISVIIGGIIAARQYGDILVNLTPIYFFEGLLFVIVGLIFLFNQRKQYWKMLMAYLLIPISLVVAIFLARPYIEPWVSCKAITDVFKTIDQSDTPVLASKFYVRGVRYYTDRPVAVIDINGKGFWSSHPIPFLSTTQMVLDFLNERLVTYAIVKESSRGDLIRINRGRYIIEDLEEIGGKFILRITKK